jgi:hypothetical protein
MFASLLQQLMVAVHEWAGEEQRATQENSIQKAFLSIVLLHIHQLLYEATCPQKPDLRDSKRLLVDLAKFASAWS